MSQRSPQEPIRLLDDPKLDMGLRSDLEIASSHAPIAYSVDAGMQRFEQAVNGVSTIPPGGSVSGLRVLGWFVGAVALIGGAGWLLQSPSAVERDEQVAQLERGGRVAESAEIAEVAEVAEVQSQENPAVDAPALNPSAEQGSPIPSEANEANEDTAEALDSKTEAPARPQPSTREIAPPPDPPTKPSLADEAAQINQARKALAADPAKTLALMQDAETQFPEGAMIQERRGYAILALVALGRSEDAQRRAEVYLERWPKGPLSRRVSDALER